MGFSYRYTRYSAIAQFVLGLLSVVFGIADRVTMFDKSAFHTQSVVPIWMGMWILLTGIIGLLGSNRNYGNNGRASCGLIGTYLGFSVVSTIFAATIIIIYILGVVLVVTEGFPCSHRSGGDSFNDGYMRVFVKKSFERKCNVSTALGSLIIIFGILEFSVGIWASICSCMNGCCDCCYPNTTQTAQMEQIIYIQTQHGPTPYVMTQGANGVQVAIPAVMSGQVQMSATPATQVVYPSTPRYTGAPGECGGGAGVGAGHQGVVTPALPSESKCREMLPVYQA